MVAANQRLKTMKDCDLQAVRQLRNTARIEAHMERVSEHERQAAAQYEQSARNHAARTCDARQRDKEMRQEKQQAAEVAEHQRVIWRAKVLP